MVVRMRHNRSQTGNTRSHHALQDMVLALCKECGSPKTAHSVCQVCGKYNGRQVLNIHKKIEKKEKKLKTKKQESR